MPESPIRKKIARLLSHVYDSDQPYAITYTIDDQYLWLKVQKIAQLGKRFLLRCKLLNITRNAIQIEQMKVNGLEKDLYDLYHAIVINDLDLPACRLLPGLPQVSSRSHLLLPHSNACFRISLHSERRPSSL